MREVIVIGAGASGMIAAIAAAREGAKVTLLEGSPSPGNKLLLTGNGKCNLTNTSPGLEKQFHSSEAKALQQMTREVFRQFSVGDTLSCFRELGVPVVDRNGLVYPLSGQSSSVRKALLGELETLRVRLKTNAKVKSLSPEMTTAESRTGNDLDQNSGRHPSPGIRWTVETQDWSYHADRVIIACGSKAAPTTGSDGSGYVLAKQTGHQLAGIYPALTALLCADRDLASCAGCRTKALVSFRNSRLESWQERGEVQWAKDGISGIVVFNLSRHLQETLAHRSRATVLLDLLPEVSSDDLCTYIRSLADKASANDRQASWTLPALLPGLLPDRIMTFICKRCHLQAVKVRDLKQEETELFVKTVKELTLTVTGTRSASQAQTCMGGVLLSQLEPATCESRLRKGLFFAGEILDADGPCGGYQLQWCWSTGYAAGRAAAY